MTLKKIKQQRVKNADNTIIGHLNINSFRNTFVFAEEIIQVFNIFLVFESKLDNTFPTNLFKIEVYQNSRKWLFLGVYKPPNQNDIEFLNRIESILDYYSQKYENVTIIGDFNITTENTYL